MADLRGDRMRLRDGQLRIDRDIELGVKAVPEPACPHLGDLLHRPQVRDVLGMQEPHDALVSRDDRAREYRDDNGYAGQILDATVSESEPFARSLARKPE